MQILQFNTPLYDSINTHTFSIPIYSKILDINLIHNMLILIISVDDSGPHKIHKNIYVSTISSNNVNNNILLDDYRFFKSITSFDVTKNMSAFGNTIDLNIDKIETLMYLFINENPHTKEVRTNKLNSLDE